MDVVRVGFGILPLVAVRGAEGQAHEVTRAHLLAVQLVIMAEASLDRWADVLYPSDSSIASRSSSGPTTHSRRAWGKSAMFSPNIAMNPPSDSTLAMISVVVVRSTLRSSSRSPSSCRPRSCVRER
jgi:hypothetical protein